MTKAYTFLHFKLATFDFSIMPRTPTSTSPLAELRQITSSEAAARQFLRQKLILHSSLPCPSCSAQMSLTSCAPSRYADGELFRCTSCRTSASIGTGSVLAAAQISFCTFLELIFFSSDSINQSVEGCPDELHRRLPSLQLYSYRRSRGYCGGGRGEVREEEVPSGCIPSW